MEPLIAALTKDGMPSTAENCQTVLLLARTQTGWELRQEIDWRLTGAANPPEARDQVRSLILELQDCRIVVAAQLAGLAYHVFDRMGFQIFEAQSLSDRLLDEVLSDADGGEARADQSEDPTGPVPADGQGRYFLDLIRLQERHPELSSKRALRDFLRTNRAMYELKLICSHIPPWLEEELPPLRLGCRAERLEDGRLSVVISRRTCKE